MLILNKVRAIMTGAGLLTLAAAAGAATESWTMVKGNLQRTGTSDAKFALPLNLMWRHSTDAPTAGRGGLYPPLVVGPEGDRRIYFVAGRNLYCINAQSGTQVWKSEPLPSGLGAPLTLVTKETGDLVLTVTSTGRMTGFRTSDGGVGLEAEAKASVQGASPFVINTADGERIIISTGGGRLIAFQKDGKLDPNFGFKLGGGTMAITSTPAVTEDGKTLFLTLQDQKLYALDLATGKQLYSTPLGTTSFHSPVLMGDKVVVAVGSSVKCLSQKSGNQVWEYKTGLRGQISTSPVGVTTGVNGTIFAGTERGDIYCLDLSNGNKRWGLELGPGISVGHAVITPDALLVGAKNDVFYAIKPSDGRIMWQYRMQAQRVMVPVAADPANAAGAGGGAEGGEPGATRPKPRPKPPAAVAGAPAADPLGDGMAQAPPTGTLRTFGVSAAPVAVDGQIFVLGDNAALYAFESTPFDAAAPYASEASLSLYNSEKKFESYLLDPEDPMVLPGAAPIYFAVELIDTGTGVQPDSIKVLLNQQILAGPTRLIFNAGTGVLSVNLVEAKPGQRAVLPDGVYTLAISAKDYAGNELDYTGTFTVDRAAPAPAPKAPTPPATTGGTEGTGSTSTPIN